MDEYINKIGALEAANKTLQAELTALKAERAELQANLNKNLSELEDLKANNAELKADLNKNLSKLEDLKDLIKSLRAKILVMLVLIAAICFGAFAAYYLYSAKYEELQNKLAGLQQAADRRAYEDDAKVRADRVISAVRDDVITQKFYNSGSLVYVDCLENNNNYYNADYIEYPAQGRAVAGSLNLSALNLNFFCREYRNSVSEKGFLNFNALKSAFNSINQGGLNIRSNERFMFNADSSALADKINLILNKAFLSVNALDAKNNLNNLNNLSKNIADNLSDEAVFRFFFATRLDGVYVVGIAKGSNLISCYIASDKPAVDRNALNEALKGNIAQSGQTLDIWLWKPDNKLLQGNSNFNTCIDVFINQLASYLNIK